MDARTVNLEFVIGDEAEFGKKSTCSGDRV